ncbi:hypothetical protein THIOSC13_100003 [uncultured Thiomicrorhabdus sp.]
MKAQFIQETVVTNVSRARVDGGDFSVERIHDDVVCSEDFKIGGTE